MILSDEDLNSRLASDENIHKIIVREKLDKLASTAGLEVRKLNPDVGKRGPEIPAVIRELIAVTAGSSGELQKDVAKEFQVTQPMVSQITRGMVHNSLDDELVEISNKTKAQKTEEAHSKALDALMLGLDKVNAGLPGVTSVKEAAKISVDMSRVVATLKKKDGDEDKPRTLVIISAPAQKTENQFEVIDV